MQRERSATVASRENVTATENCSTYMTNFNLEPLTTHRGILCYELVFVNPTSFTVVKYE